MAPSPFQAQLQRLTLKSRNRVLPLSNSNFEMSICTVYKQYKQYCINTIAGITRENVLIVPETDLIGISEHEIWKYSPDLNDSSTSSIIRYGMFSFIQRFIAWNFIGIVPVHTVHQTMI